MKKAKKLSVVFLLSLLVLIASFIVLPLPNILMQGNNYQNFSLETSNTAITIRLFGTEQQIRYRFDGRYTDYQTLYYETPTRDVSQIVHDADVLRARLKYLGTDLYELTALPEEGRIKFTLPSSIDAQTLDQFIAQKGQLTFTSVIQNTAYSIDETEEIPDTPEQTEPIVNSFQIQDGDIARVSYSELSDMPTVEIRFANPAELALRIPASLFRWTDNQTVYVSIDSNNLGQSTQSIYQLNGESPSTTAYNTPWELKSLTLAVYSTATATDEQEITPETVYRLLNFGQLQTDWTLSQIETIPSTNWQPTTLLLIPLFGVAILSCYIVLTRTRIEWIIFTTQGVAITAFISAFAVKTLGVSLSPFSIPAYALTTLVFVWTIFNAAKQSNKKIKSGASLLTSMKAAMIEARSDMIWIFGLIFVIGTLSKTPALHLAAITSLSYFLSILAVQHSISTRLQNEKTKN